LSGVTGPQQRARHAEDDDFVQAGALYRVMTEEGRRRLIANLAGSLAQVTRPDVVERSIGHFRRADPGYGQRLADAVAALRGGRR
ncbi:MAG TPA: catalase-related domain-containing protein, partial [Myxococcales bacterium]